MTFAETAASVRLFTGPVPAHTTIASCRGGVGDLTSAFDLKRTSCVITAPTGSAPTGSAHTGTAPTGTALTCITPPSEAILHVVSLATSPSSSNSKPSSTCLPSVLDFTARKYPQRKTPILRQPKSPSPRLAHCDLCQVALLF